MRQSDPRLFSGFSFNSTASTLTVSCQHFSVASFYYSLANDDPDNTAARDRPVDECTLSRLLRMIVLTGHLAMQTILGGGRIAGIDRRVTEEKHGYSTTGHVRSFVVSSPPFGVASKE